MDAMGVDLKKKQPLDCFRLPSVFMNPFDTSCLRLGEEPARVRFGTFWVWSFFTFSPAWQHEVSRLFSNKAKGVNISNVKIESTNTSFTFCMFWVNRLRNHTFFYIFMVPFNPCGQQKHRPETTFGAHTPTKTLAKKTVRRWRLRSQKRVPQLRRDVRRCPRFGKVERMLDGRCPRVSTVATVLGEFTWFVISCKDCCNALKSYNIHEKLIYSTKKTQINRSQGVSWQDSHLGTRRYSHTTNRYHGVSHLITRSIQIHLCWNHSWRNKDFNG